jgi:hypothetical protein
MKQSTTNLCLRRAIQTSAVVLGFMLFPAAGQDDPNSNKSIGPVVILPPPASELGATGKATAGLHLPGREYRSGEGWWALSCAVSCELAATRLAVASKPHPQYDGDPVPGQWLAFSPAPPVRTLIVFKPFRAPADQLSLRAGPVTTYHPGLLSKLKRSTNSPGTMEGELVLPDGRVARFVPTLLLPNPAKLTNPNRDPSTSILMLDLVLDNKRQNLGQFNFGIEGMGGVKPQEYIRWAGDLDGDGQLDLIVSLEYSSGTEYVLWLSSMAKNGELLGQAGRFNYFPIDIAGC